MPKWAQLRTEAACHIQQASTMREQAAEQRLQVWLERLAQIRPHSCRETALGRALDAAISVLSADWANIQRVHPSGRGLVLEAQRGFQSPFLDFFAFVDSRHTSCGLGWQDHRPVVVEDIVRSPIFVQTQGLEVLLEAGIRAVKSAPLLGRSGDILGTLSVYYRQPRPHLDSELARFQTLAAAVAALVDGK